MHVVEENLRRRVIDPRPDRPDGDALADEAKEIKKKDGQTVRAVRGLVARGRSRQKEHEIAMLCPRRPDLLTIHDIPIAVPYRCRLQGQRVGTTRRFGDAEGLKAKRTIGDLWQIRLLLLGTSMPQ